MIIVKNRELLIPENERYIGTPLDNYADNRLFRINRFSQSGEDLSGLTFRLDLKYPTERRVYTFTTSTSHTGGSVVVLSKTFVKTYATAGTYVFTFDGSNWKYNNAAVDLEDIGIVINFTPVSADTMTVVSAISNVTGDIVLLTKEITDDYINLTWLITENQLAVPGTVFVALRGSDADASVKYATFYAALYVEANLDQTVLPASGINELEQLENMTAEGLRKLEYLYNRYRDLDKASEDAEAWAVGKRDGVDVGTTDDTYHNNSKYYAELREEASHLAEAYARGTVEGVPVGSGQIGYHDNASYWRKIAESWAIGQTGMRIGENTNNSEYWSEVSHMYANQVSYNKVYSNVAEMVADTEVINGQVVRTLGYHAVNDGGGALYRISDSGTANNIDILACDNGLKAYLIVQSPINALQIGCDNTGTNDNATLLNAYFNLYQDWSIYFPNGRYKINSEVDTLGSVIMEQDAYFVTSAALDCCVHINKNFTPGSGGFPYGWQHDLELSVHVDCNKVAKTGIRTDKLGWSKCDFTILNPVEYGVVTGYAASSGHAENNFKIKVVCDNTFVNNAVGLYVKSYDDVYDDLYFDNTRKGVVAGAGACMYKNIHHWLSMEDNWSGSVVFEMAVASKSVIDFLYVDTVETGIKYSGNALTVVSELMVNHISAAMNFVLVPQTTCESFNIVDCTGMGTNAINQSRLVIQDYIGNDVITSGTIRFAANGLCPCGTHFGYSSDYLTIKWPYDAKYAPEGCFIVEGTIKGIPDGITVGTWFLHTVNAPFGKIQELHVSSSAYGDTYTQLVLTGTDPVAATTGTYLYYYKRVWNKYGTGTNAWGRYWSMSMHPYKT